MTIRKSIHKLCICCNTNEILNWEHKKYCKNCRDFIRSKVQEKFRTHHNSAKNIIEKLIE